MFKNKNLRVFYLRLYLEFKYFFGIIGVIWNIFFLRDIFSRDLDGSSFFVIFENLKVVRITFILVFYL